jgi:type II secretory pathway predicted ATPase ExeA
MTEPTKKQFRRLRAHFAYSKVPFGKSMWAAQMFDSCSQREFIQGLQLWTDLRGLAMVIGPSGVGKSISLRRYQQELDEARYQIIEFTYLPSTVNGFLRSLCRSLSLPMRLHSTDLFDAAQRHLASYEKDLGKHPILLIDDAEGLRPEVLDTIRRLTCFDLDSEDRFSVLLSGTDALIPLLADATLTSLRSRFAFTCSLRPFGLEDTINYVRFHLQRSELDPKLFTEPAIKKLFQASQGRPRKINQLAIQSLIAAAVQGRSDIDGDFMAHMITTHPLYNMGADK